MRHQHFVLGLIGVAALGMASCKPGGDGKKDNQDTSGLPGPEDPAKNEQQQNPPTGTNTGTNTSTNQTGEPTMTVTGAIALSLGLQAPKGVTHVVAAETEGNRVHVAEVHADGKFELPIEKDKNWVLTYADATKVGKDMLVSIFNSGALDTLATTGDSKDLNFGTVDTSAEKATSSLSDTDLLAGIGMTTDAAATYGALDDVSLRYVNPDIDADGKLDAANDQKFDLDFHNRFNLKKPAGQGGGDLAMKDIKNAFPGDDTDLVFTGSGIIPWFKDELYASKPDAYSWTFDHDVVLNQPCDGGTYNNGDTLPAGTKCNLTLSGGSQSVADHPSVELRAAVDGEYKLEAGGKTFTWTNVKVSDFSGGEGFIALFIRMDVSDADKLTGLSWKWRRKVSGAWVAATPEELKLIVSKQGGFVSLKVDGNSDAKSISARVPLSASEGSLVFATAKLATAGAGDDGTADGYIQGLTADEVKAGIDWSRALQNPGISYDDKLGMRFFFGFNGQN